MPKKAQNGAPSAAELLNGSLGGSETSSVATDIPLGSGEVSNETPKSAEDLRIADLQTQVAALMQMMKENGNAQSIKLPKIKQYSAKLAFLDGELPVVAYSNAKTKKTGEDEYEIKMRVGVLKEGKIVEKDVEYVDFMENTPRFAVLITKQTKTSVEKNQMVGGQAARVE